MHAYVRRTIAAYDQSTAQYERATRDMTPTAELDLFTSLLPHGQGQVLDVGCAYGRDTALLAERGVKVIGIDLSLAFVERARELNPGLAFEQMDACALTFPEARFTGIWCQATLLHLTDDDVAVALREFARVLVPGGAVFASFKEGEGSEGVVEKFSSDYSRFYQYQTPKNVRTLLTAAGFDVVTVECENERERFGPGYRDLNWIHAFAVRLA